MLEKHSCADEVLMAQSAQQAKNLAAILTLSTRDPQH